MPVSCWHIYWLSIARAKRLSVHGLQTHEPIFIHLVNTIDIHNWGFCGVIIPVFPSTVMGSIDPPLLVVRAMCDDIRDGWYRIVKTRGHIDVHKMMIYIPGQRPPDGRGFFETFGVVVWNIYKLSGIFGQLWVRLENHLCMNCCTRNLAPADTTCFVNIMQFCFRVSEFSFTPL